MPQDQSMLVFTMDKRYKIKNDGSPVTLDVIIGDKGPSPDIDVKLDSKKLVNGSNVSVKNLLIGNNEDLDKKILKITGNVVDTAEDSNKITVTVKVKGGERDFEKKFSVTVDEEGEEVDLAFVIRFTD